MIAEIRLVQEYFRYVLENTYTQIAFNAIIIILLALLLQMTSRYLFKRAENNIEKRKTIEDKRVRRTRLQLMKTVVSNFISILAIILILLPIPGFKTFSYSLLAGAGIAAIIIGFAAQKTLANIVAGMSIALYSPFRVGDKIKILEENGEVEEINLRHTIIKTWDNKRIIIPNAMIAEKEIVNYSLKEEKMLRTLDMGISYDSDIDKSRKIMINLAKKHPDNLIFETIEDGKKVIKEPYVRVTNCGDFSVNLRLYFWVKDNPTGFKMQFELLESIKKAFDKEGIEIPFPYRTIVYKKDIDAEKRRKK